MKDFQAREVTLALRCYDIIIRMRAQAHDQQIDLGAKPESPVEKLHRLITMRSGSFGGFCSSYNLAFYKDKSCTHEMGMRSCQENREHWAKVNDEEAKECKKCHDTAHLLSQNMINEIEKEASE